jgi:SIR2-like domain
MANRRCVGIYHLHGFVPQDPSRYPYHTWEGGLIEDVRLPVESLVFTDEQYWQTVARPGWFADRIFAQALCGICVFVGLSKTDINVIRWLAHNATEVKRDFRLVAAGWPDKDEVEFDATEELSRHSWITEKKSDALPAKNESDFGIYVLQNVLRNRGVDLIEIPSRTSKEFYDWWKGVFLS